MEIKVECGNCGQHVLLDDSAAGQTFACPGCGQSITARPVPARPIPAREVQTNVKQGAAIGGWICFGVATLIMFIPFPTWFIYGPLYLAAFILSIVAMAQKRIASGLTLLLATVIGAPILFVIAFFVGLATWAGAIQQAAVAAAANTNRVANASRSNTNSGSAATPAFEMIEGAFGKKLGEDFQPTQASGTTKLTDGTPMYEFEMTTPFRSFTRYYVLITPTTHKIYSIWATGSAGNLMSAQKEQAVIMELLKEKYGPADKEGLRDAMGDIKRITQGDRYILTKVSGLSDATIQIRYHDEKLEKLAEKERLATEVQKTDKTGL